MNLFWSFGLGLVLLGATPIITQTPSLLHQGQIRYQNGQYMEAISIWRQAVDRTEGSDRIRALNFLSSAYQELGNWQQAHQALQQSRQFLGNNGDVLLLAQTLNSEAALELAEGKVEEALIHWQQAEQFYREARNDVGIWGSQINQAQAWQVLGHYKRAKSLLETVTSNLKQSPDTMLKADALRSLGVALQTIGDHLQSKDLLEESLAMSRRLGSPTDRTLFAIGNLARDLRQYDVALAYYRAIVDQTPGQVHLETQLNILSLLIKTEQRPQAELLATQIYRDLTKLAPSRMAVDAKVNFAESVMRLTSGNLSYDLESVLQSAIAMAQSLQDQRATAFALSQLAKFYARSPSRSLKTEISAQQALNLAQSVNATDIVALAAAQLGRSLQQRGQIPEAIAAYRQAFSSLQVLRQDIAAIDREVQFDFQESVEPIYREFVSLLLQPDASQENLHLARDVIEALQVAELDNFFGDACLKFRPTTIDAIDPHAAVIYPIMLADRLEVVLSLSDRTLRHYSTPKSVQVDQTLEQLYSSLFLGFDNNSRIKLAQQVYNWLLRPAESVLAQNRVETLVFVLDGALRNLPMAALHDGNQYLVEKYAIALSPGLQLLPQASQTANLSALVAGLTEARQGFTALPAVKAEVMGIADQIKSSELLAKSTILLDQQFTSSSFQTEVNRQGFPIVHLATHGQFSSDPDDTFLLTWDGRINVRDLDLVFAKRRDGDLNAIDLLVLSACQTAEGDRRAALGLAGFALRSGARATLASLWSVNDSATAQLMNHFYQELTRPHPHLPARSKADLFRQAQLTLLRDPKYSHPYYWAAFVLIGNWL